MFPSYINQSVDLLCKSTGFYMMGTVVVKGLTYLSYSQYNKKIHNHEKNWLITSFSNVSSQTNKLVHAQNFCNIKLPGLRYIGFIGPLDWNGGHRGLQPTISKNISFSWLQSSKCLLGSPHLLVGVKPLLPSLKLLQ